PAAIAARIDDSAELAQREDEDGDAMRARQAPAPVSPEAEDTGVVPPAPPVESAAGARDVARTRIQAPATTNDSLPVRQKLNLPPRTPQPSDEAPLAAL